MTGNWFKKISQGSFILFLVLMFIMVVAKTDMEKITHGTGLAAVPLSLGGNQQNNDTGADNDPYYGGYAENLSSQTEAPAGTSDLGWDQQIHHTGTPWGGLVVGPKIPCNCENPKSYMVSVNDYVSKGTVYIKYEDMYSKAYMFWDLNPGQYGLGTLDLGGVCKINMGQCVDYPVYGIINRGPGFGSSGSMGLSFPSILGSENPIDFMDGGTVPATYTF